MMDKTQKSREQFERVARNMVDGPLSMFFHDDEDYGRIYVAVGRRKGQIEVIDSQLRIRSNEHQPWTGVWFAMVGESPFGQEIRALPYFWGEKDIMADVVAQAQPTLQSFRAGGAFGEGWWRAGRP